MAKPEKQHFIQINDESDDESEHNSYIYYLDENGEEVIVVDDAFSIFQEIAERVLNY